MEAKVLFTETLGSVDTEGNEPNGVMVSLSQWRAENFQLPNHYLLKKVVMLDRQYILDVIEVHTSSMHGIGPAQEIRRAIGVFDQLVADWGCDGNGVVIEKAGAE